jgi:hypothetical protein
MGCQARAGGHSSPWLEARGLQAAFGDTSTSVGQESGHNALRPDGASSYRPSTLAWPEQQASPSPAGQ